MSNIFKQNHDISKSKTFLEPNSPTFLHVSKKILARQSIFRSIDCNIHHNFSKGPTFLTEQQIKMSSIYEKLLQRIDKTRRREEEENIQHQRRMRQIQNQIQGMKKSTQQGKVEIWEVKNQVFELQEICDNEMQEYQQICQAIRAEEEEQDNEEQQEEDDEGDYNQYGEDDSDNQQQQQGEESQNNPSDEVESFSNPTCSIKYMISNRSITSPGISKLQIGQGRAPFSSTDQEEYTQMYTEDGHQQANTDQNILSFKKSQHYFCANT